MKKVDINMDFPLPSDCLYLNNQNRNEIFRETDHPLAFYDLTDNEQKELLSWCGNLEKIKNINTEFSSYGLKHFFERSINGFYINNGAFKGAMIICGFLVGDISKLNWDFNISQKSINKIRK